MRALLVLGLAALLLPATAARADDSPIYRRTTPRAALVDTAGMLLIGIPSGRAWGVEGILRPLPPGDAAVVVRLTVDDASVREAFVRVAYYASATARTRQLAIADSALVRYGETRLVAVILTPPRGAVAYRVRVLARLCEEALASRADAITALFGDGQAGSGWAPLLSRLLP